jgi:hypothetical protein
MNPQAVKLRQGARRRGTKWVCGKCGKKVTMFHGLRPLDIGRACAHEFARQVKANP